MAGSQGAPEGALVVAKFEVTARTQRSWNPAQESVHCECRYDTSIPEDRRFCDATPSGHIDMEVNNPAALEQLKLGRKFHVYFVPVEE